MKLIIAIVSNDDYLKLSKYLNSMPLYFLKVSQTGGILNVGNCTVLIKVSSELLNDVIKNISQICKMRTVKKVNKKHPLSLENLTTCMEKVGGGALFIITLDNFIRI